MRSTNTNRGTKPTLQRLLAIVAAITLFACRAGTEPGADVAGPPVALTITPSALSLIVGGEERLTAQAFDARAQVASAAFAWSSADPAVASVRSDGTVTAVSTGSTTVTATAGSLRATVTVSVKPDTLFAQWAAGATASTQWSPGEWSALQATGAPDVTGCTDDPKAWASLSTEVDWLELTYAQPVRPSEIQIHEVWAVGSIVKVEVKEVSGRYQTVYTALPTDPGSCPRILTIAVTGVGAMVSAVRVTVDQQVRFDWNEIDAVRLTGYR